MSNYTDYYRRLHNDVSIPNAHIDYLHKISYTPSVIYDIGAAALHWTKEAKKVWPNAKYYAFEAVLEVDEFYKQSNIEYALGVFSDVDNKEVTFYEDPVCLGGNSYYRENVKYSPAAEKIYCDASGKKRKTRSIDSIVSERGFLLPDFVKIDVQGAELDILKGADYALSKCKYLIVELQDIQFNLGAPLADVTIEYLKNKGWECIAKKFSDNGPDGDYCFINTNI